MIPKKIHYCWFGGKPLPVDARRCIESWKKSLPDYEIMEWNESNFDITCNRYVREAYESCKFAFVTDYVRLYALVQEGGIYMDTDVEVLKSFDPFLHHAAFSGFENDNYVPTGMMASEKGGAWVTELLHEYDGRRFIRDDGSFDMTTNTFLITRNMENHGLVRNNTYQDFPGFVTFYPSDFFCPKDHRDGVVKLTDNSVCIHHFAGSWLSNSSKLRHKCKTVIASVFGKTIASLMSRIVN